MSLVRVRAARPIIKVTRKQQPRRIEKKDENKGRRGRRNGLTTHHAVLDYPLPLGMAPPEGGKLCYRNLTWSDERLIEP